MEKNEFFYPVYENPVVIQTNVNTTYAAVGIPKRYYDMDLTGYANTAAFQKRTLKLTM